MPKTATPPTTAADAALAGRLRVALTRLARRLRQENEAGITPSQLSALTTVAQAGAVTSGELAALERVQPPTMTRILAALEEAGLVSRTVDAGDRRVVRVAATTAGRRLLDRNRTRKDLYLAARLRRLPAADRDVLARAAEVMERLVEDER